MITRRKINDIYIIITTLTFCHDFFFFFLLFTIFIIFCRYFYIEINDVHIRYFTFWARQTSLYDLPEKYEYYNRNVDEKNNSNL